MTSPRARHLRRSALAAAVLLVAARTSAAQDPAACREQPHCTAVSTFTAAVTDFRTSQSARNTHLVTAIVRFTNRTPRPLILGYVQRSGLVTDDQGIRFEVNGPRGVRGIGEITSQFDPKFVLQPGEASDARFEFITQVAANQILGTRYDIELAVREIDPVAGGQFRLGREHALQFHGFGAEGVAGVAGVAASGVVAAGAPSSPAMPAMPAMPGDPCAGRPRCYGAGPFVAEVERFIGATEGNKKYHVLHVNLRVRNVTAAPLVLAYKAGTDVVVDNLGNRYYWGHAGSHDMSASGIGKVEGSSADPQFTLAPGESRSATFTMIRYDAGGHEIGTSFSQDLILTQLEILPSRQVRVARDYAVSFRDLTTGGGMPANVNAGAAVNAGRRLLDALRHRGGKP